MEYWILAVIILTMVSSIFEIVKYDKKLSYA